jgi:hypothetical protein
MIPARVRAPFDERPLAREGVVAAALLGGFVLWIQLLLAIGLRLAGVAESFLTVESNAWALAETVLVADAVAVVGMVAFAAAYVRVRGLSVTLGLPDRSELWAVAAAAVAVPAASVAAVYGLAHATGTTLSSLTGTFVAEDVSLVVPATLMALQLLLGLPAYVLVTHVLVQRTLRAAAGPSVAIGVTTLVVGLAGPTELVTTTVTLQTAVVALLLPVSVALPVYASHSFDVDWLPWLCALPLALFGIGLVTSWLADVDGVAGAAFGLVQIGIVGLAAYSCEETGSLLPPALAYASFVVATEAMVLFFEAGVRP